MEKQNQENPPISPRVTQPPKEKFFLSWSSPSRIFRKHSKEFYTNLGAIVLLVCIILLFIKQIWLILAIIAFSFFMYVIDTVKPEKIEHKISDQGIFTAGKKFFYDQLGRFWIEKEYGQNILYIENYIGFPVRLIILLADQKKEEIENLLKNYLVMEKPELSQAEKWSKWLSEKIILEKPQNPSSQK